MTFFNCTKTPITVFNNKYVEQLYKRSDAGTPLDMVHRICDGLTIIEPNRSVMFNEVGCIYYIHSPSGVCKIIPEDTHFGIESSGNLKVIISGSAVSVREY